MNWRSCPMAGCRCTHEDGCVKGWIDAEDGSTTPCPVCRWNRVQMPDESRSAWMDRLRAQDAAWKAAG